MARCFKMAIENVQRNEKPVIPGARDFCRRLSRPTYWQTQTSSWTTKNGVSSIASMSRDIAKKVQGCLNVECLTRADRNRVLQFHELQLSWRLALVIKLCECSIGHAPFARLSMSIQTNYLTKALTSYSYRLDDKTCPCVKLGFITAAINGRKCSNPSATFAQSSGTIGASFFHTVAMTRERKSARITREKVGNSRSFREGRRQSRAKFRRRAKLPTDTEEKHRHGNNKKRTRVRQ